jgi:hypothetical protein
MESYSGQRMQQDVCDEVASYRIAWFDAAEPTTRSEGTSSQPSEHDQRQEQHYAPQPHESQYQAPQYHGSQHREPQHYASQYHESQHQHEQHNQQSEHQYYQEASTMLLYPFSSI